jgi:hypothetical protein
MTINGASEMIRRVDVRAVVQNNDNIKNKHALTVISANTNEQYPFQTTTADIQVVSNSRKGISGYALPIYSDDFIRLQVRTSMDNRNWSLWRDLFIGMIQYPKSVLGSTNTINLHCVGLMDEVNWSAINETSKWEVTLDAQDYFNYFLGNQNIMGTPYRRYLQYSPNYVLRGVSVPSYSCTFNQTYMVDLINSMEQQSGYIYRAYPIPHFDANLNLDAIYLGWKPRQTNPLYATNRYAVVENSWSYISSEFASSIEELRNRVTVVGSTSDGILDAREDATSIANYGKRARVDTCNWIKTISQCTNTAAAILNYTKDPDIYGSASLVGCSEAHPGDLVYCKSPSQEVNGNPVETYLPVYRVGHNISASGGWVMNIDLGKINKDAYDYIGLMSKNINMLQKNAVTW